MKKEESIKLLESALDDSKYTEEDIMRYQFYLLKLLNSLDEKEERDGVINGGDFIKLKNIIYDYIKVVTSRYNYIESLLYEFATGEAQSNSEAMKQLIENFKNNK